MLPLRILSPYYLEKYAFSMLHCIGQNVQCRMGRHRGVGFTRIDAVFAKICAVNDFPIPPPVTLIFGLIISKLLCQLFLSWVTSHEGLNVVQCSVFCRAMLCISAAYAVARCPSVWLSVSPSVHPSHLCILLIRINVGLSTKFFTVG